VRKNFKHEQHEITQNGMQQAVAMVNESILFGNYRWKIHRTDVWVLANHL